MEENKSIEYNKSIEQNSNEEFSVRKLVNYDDFESIEAAENTTNDHREKLKIFESELTDSIKLEMKRIIGIGEIMSTTNDENEQKSN